MNPELLADLPAGMVADIVAAQVLNLKGHIRVDIIDDRTGRIIDSLEADNYVNTAEWTRYAKALQRMIWMYGFPITGITSTTRDTDDGLDTRSLPSFRNDHLVCWTDNTAENTADVFAFGEIIAWATRWQQGSPSTRQGLVQPSLCSLTETTVTWVFEWTTTNGNGTFQSVGWRRIAPLLNTGDNALPDHPVAKSIYTSGYVNAVSSSTANTAWVIGMNSQNFFRGGMYYNSSDGKFYAVHAATAGTISKLISIPVTIAANGNYSLGTTADESANAIAAGLRGDNLAVATALTMSITRLGSSGDWIAVGLTGITTSRRPFIRRVTPAGAVTYTNANGGTYAAESMFTDVTYDGTNLWVIATTAAGVPAIHRIDPATGTISATISAVASVPAYWTAGNLLVPTATAHHWSRIEWDPDASCLWIVNTDGFIFNIDTSGNWMGVLLYNGGGVFSAVTGDYAGTPQDRGASSVDIEARFFKVSSWSASQPESLAMIAYTTTVGTQGTLHYFDGRMWSFSNNNAPNNLANVNGANFDGRPNFASRSLLGAPAVKNNTQSMRISYTITFT